jgi:hypothetical protein
MGVYTMGVYLMGVHPMGVYLMGVHLTGVHLMGVHLMGVQSGCLIASRHAVPLISSHSLHTVIDSHQSRTMQHMRQHPNRQRSS